MNLTIEECKNEIARVNNFDSFDMAIRYTFNRDLLQSEYEFLNKIINDSIVKYADQEAKAYANWLANQVMFPLTHGIYAIFGSDEDDCIPRSGLNKGE